MFLRHVETKCHQAPTCSRCVLLLGALDEVRDCKINQEHDRVRHDVKDWHIASKAKYEIDYQSHQEKCAAEDAQICARTWIVMANSHRHTECAAQEDE